ncbi:hypothetical protein [Clostridium manihotivorum]|uniref:Uncharacterized protein n=1 Tax=Clostridium manihotivorum TaxID=2320868 RepID=A0A3R5QVJ1_9CLOT|nr:hypothetical protein [Clostridium manihotivorum]QAA30515.1 hypothetical protein C1I91_01900 [Clostridium manihotivorum]
MDKKKWAAVAFSVSLIIAAVALLINMITLTNNNRAMINERGEKIQANILDLYSTVKDAEKDLANKDTKSLQRDYWKFNEAGKLDLPKKSVPDFLLGLTREYQDLNRLKDSNGSDQQMAEAIDRTQLKLEKLEGALNIIIEDCKIDPVKYYFLDKEENKAMEKALNMLTESNS